jgi:hypothetical protein
MAVAGGLKPPTPGGISCEDEVNAAQGVSAARHVHDLFRAVVINIAGKLVVLDTGNGPGRQRQLQGGETDNSAPTWSYGPSPMRNRIGE